jgi:hypothetical protein
LADAFPHLDAHHLDEPIREEPVVVQIREEREDRLGPASTTPSAAISTFVSDGSVAVAVRPAAAVRVGDKYERHGERDHDDGRDRQPDALVRILEHCLQHWC